MQKKIFPDNFIYEISTQDCGQKIKSPFLSVGSWLQPPNDLWKCSWRVISVCI